MLNAKRDGKAVERFFRKVLTAAHTVTSRVVTVDKNAAYSVAIEALKDDETLEAKTELWQVKYLNNVIEQDHTNIKRVVKPTVGFQSFNTARQTLKGVEAVTMVRKGQVSGIEKGNSVSQAEFIAKIFGVIA